MKKRMMVFVATMAMVVNGCGGDTSSIDPRTTAALLKSGEIVPGTLSLKVGETGSVAGQLRDGNGAVITTTGDWTWAMDAGGVASVAASAEKGTVTALKVGQTTVRARFTYVSGSSPAEINAAAIINVTAAAQVATTLNITPGSADLSIGETGNIVCAAFDAAGVAMTGVTFQWTSGAPGVATVANGTVSAVSPGPAIITCREAASGLTKTAVVTVHARVLTFAPASVSVAQGASLSVSKFVTDFRGNTVAYPGTNITYTVAANGGAIATATPGLNGASIQGLTVGSTSFTARLAEGDASATLPVTVTALTGCRKTTTLTYNVTVVSDPGNNVARVSMPGTMTVTITLNELTGQIEVTGPSPFILARGVLNTNTCALIATGLGPIGGTANVKGEMSGFYPAGGKLALTYAVGVDAGVGNIVGLNNNQAITYLFTQQ